MSRESRYFESNTKYYIMIGLAVLAIWWGKDATDTVDSPMCADEYGYHPC